MSEQPASDVPRAGGERRGWLHWIDQRLPVSDAWRKHFTEYRVPRNLNFWYVFGSLALLVLVIQYVSGIFLTMHYKPDAQQAFDSVDRIMRDVRWGWLLRYVHSTGASLFFVVLYLHIFRGLIYGSYRQPRELVWLVGCFTFLCIMAEAFFGYLLPWGQMSYWGAQVIVNLFSAIPGVGADLALWIRGDNVISDITLNRFFALHVVALPLILLVVVVLHMRTLRHVGSSNPDGIDIGSVRDLAAVSATHLVSGGGGGGRDLGGGDDSVEHPDTLPFHPYFVVKDIFAAGIFLTLFAAIVFFAPTMGGFFLEPDNFIPANPLVTPNEIAPVWYFMPFYSMLRAATSDFKIVLMVIAGIWGLHGCLLARGRKRSRGGRMAYAVVALLLVLAMALTDAKLWGVVLMLGGVIVLFFLPWLDRCAVRSIRYRPSGQRVMYGVLVVAFVVLGIAGAHATNAATMVVTQVCTVLYFGFFLGMPWWSAMGRCLPEPARITMPRGGRSARRQDAGERNA